MKGLLSRAPHAGVRLVDREGDRDDGQRVPWVVEGEEREDRAEAGLGGSGGKIRLQHLEAADDLQQSA